MVSVFILSSYFADFPDLAVFGTCTRSNFKKGRERFHLHHMFAHKGFVRDIAIGVSFVFLNEKVERENDVTVFVGYLTARMTDADFVFLLYRRMGKRNFFMSVLCTLIAEVCVMPG